MNQDHDIEMRLSFIPGEDGYNRLAKLQKQTSRRRRFYYLYNLGLQAERHPMRFPVAEVMHVETSEGNFADAKPIEMRLCFSSDEDGYLEMAMLRKSAARRKRAYYLYQRGLRAERGITDSAASIFVMASTPASQVDTLPSVQFTETSGMHDGAQGEALLPVPPAASKRQKIDFSF